MSKELYPENLCESVANPLRIAANVLDPSDVADAGAE